MALKDMVTHAPHIHRERPVNWSNRHIRLGLSAGSIPAHVTISNLNIEDMKEFFEMMEKDFLSEGFSRKEWVIYGIIAPVVLVIGCVIADGIARL